jgi:phosphoglycolate phosphatase
VTPPVDDPETLRRILAATDALLLDFDGPICSVFSGIPAPVVADQLRNILAEGGHTGLPDDIRTATDPFDVFFYAAKLGQDEAHYVEAAFRAHEVEAVRTAEPTNGAHDLIRAWKAAGRRLAIVSNNSQNAVETYLDLHNLHHLVDHVAARPGADTSMLKPHPYLVTRAVTMLHLQPSGCALVGDSVTDVQAAQGANVSAIAFANKPEKAESFMQAEIIVTRMELLLAAVSVVEEFRPGSP